MITRLARWWLARKDRRPKVPAYVPSGECICGKVVTGEGLHVVVALQEDDVLAEAGGGASAMSADFCVEHCPGGCMRGCATMEA